MASLRVFVMYFLVFYVNVNIQITRSHSQICLPEKHVPLFVFGDSLFDVGNNNYIKTITFLLANYAPYGETFFKYPTGRFSDGRVIPDFIAEYAKLPLLPPFLDPASGHDEYIYGANFASAGAGALVETRRGTVIDLTTQATYFKQVIKLLRKKLGDEEAKALVARAVYIINVGGNDYSDPFLANSNSSTVVLPYPQQEFVDVVIGNISSVIQEIYDEGGRKFGLLNVGPLNCFPILRILKNGSSIDACQEEKVSALTRLHRDALPKMLQTLDKQLKGFKYSLTDFYSALVEVMKYPSKYGFKEGSEACCGGGACRGDYSCGGKRGIKEYELCENVREYVFFDAIHPTDSAAQHYANLMWTGNRNITAPYNLKQLFEFEV